MTADTALHWPEATTAIWMAVSGVLAACAYGAFSVYHGWPEWRIRYLQWRGEPVTAYDIEATTGYRPRAPEAPQTTVLHALSIGVAVAVWVWSGDYSGPQAVAISKLAEAVPLVLILLWSARKPRGEVGMPPVDEPQPRDRPSWWAVLFLLGLAAFAWFAPLDRLEPLVGFNLFPAFFATLLTGSGLMMLREVGTERANGYEEGAIAARNQAVLCFVCAAAVLAIWGLAWVHFA